MRGNPNDFDRWANESGDPQWTHKNLLPFFKKMETYRGDFPIGKKEWKKNSTKFEVTTFLALFQMMSMVQMVL